MCVWSGCVYFVLPSFFVICFIYPAEKEDVIENDITYHYHFSLLIYILMN